MLLELGTALTKISMSVPAVRNFLASGSAALTKIGARRNGSVEPGFIVQFRVTIPSTYGDGNEGFRGDDP
jgi:hypothetical protein